MWRVTAPPRALESRVAVAAWVSGAAFLGDFFLVFFLGATRESLAAAAVRRNSGNAYYLPGEITRTPGRNSRNSRNWNLLDQTIAGSLV